MTVDLLQQHLTARLLLHYTVHTHKTHPLSNIIHYGTLMKARL